jgi:hypothetical protein
MVDSGKQHHASPIKDVASRESQPASIPVVTFGLSLSVFFTISYAFCILLYLLFPDVGSGHALLSLFLPWFKLLSWQSFFLGLIESLVLGWYVALVFGTLFNVFAARAR